MKKKRSRPSLAGKTSLRGTGCLSSAQAGRPKKHDRIEGEDMRERSWMERLKRDMERAEEYFWRQTPERRALWKNFHSIKARLWKGNDFCFGKGTTA
jgi:hypothetical protein